MDSLDPILFDMSDIAQQSTDRVLGLDDLRSRASITVEEAGQLLGLSRTSTYAAIRRDEIPHVRVGGRIIVPTSALLRLLDA